MDIEKIISALKLKGYLVSYFQNAGDASAYLNQRIDNESVGFGDSATLLSMALFESLSCHNEVFDPHHCPAGMNFIETAQKSLTTKIYLTSINAMSEGGEIINIDGTGNRIAGSLFGHEKVYFVAGINKIAPTVEDAIWRARNVAAPKNALRLKLKTPCAKKGDRCYDCSSPDRICNSMVVHYKKMNDIDMEIVLINEQLGF
jgi:hypothetical protein